MAGKGVHQRTLIWAGLAPGDQAVPIDLAVSLNVYQTDAGGNVGTNNIIRPLFDAAALLEKSPLDYTYRTWMPQTGTSWGLNSEGSFFRDCKVKRKMDDTDALLLTIEWNAFSGTAAGTQRIRIITRTYVTW